MNQLSNSCVVSAATPPRDGFVEANGLSFYYKLLGRGAPLMLLHGGPGADHSYFLPWLEPLSHTHQLVLFDQRGCGRSERLQDPREYTLHNMVEDTESLRRALGLGKVALLGHSFGGLLAQACALQYPESLGSLILVGTAPSAAMVNRDFRRIKRRLPARLRKKIRNFEQTGIFRRDGRYYAEYARLCDEALLEYSYVGEPPAGESDYDTASFPVLREMWVRKSDFRIDGNLRGFDFTERLQGLRKPTLIVNGERDLVSRESTLALHQAIPASRLVVIPNSRHMVFVDHQAEFLAAVNGFLESTDR